MTGHRGIYDDPGHVIDHADAEVLELDTCLAAKFTGDRAQATASNFCLTTLDDPVTEPGPS